MDHCAKCNGFGFLPQYAGIRNGQCFKCGGQNTRGMSYHTWLNRIAEVDQAIAHRKRIINSREQFFESLKEQPLETDEDKEVYQKIRHNYEIMKKELEELRKEMKELQQIA